MEIYKRSKSSDFTKLETNGRYLPDGKLNITARWNSPGPSYRLPTAIGFINHDLTLGKRPAYSFGLKLPDPTQVPQSPGPVYLPDYKVFNTGKEKSPSSFLVGRPKQSFSNVTPGPAQYAPEKHSNITKPGTPAFTFSNRHKHLEVPTHNVGPNQYAIKNTIGNNNYVTSIKNAPSYSISSRNNKESKSQNYHGLYYPSLDFIKSTCPKWSIIGRNGPFESQTQTPGPNQYKVDYLRVNPRSATMGIRHSEFCNTGLPAHFLVDD